MGPVTRAVRFTAAAMLAAAVGTVTQGVGPAEAEDGNDVVSALVAPGSSTDPDGSYFVLDADPGDTITQTILVHNERPYPVEAHIEGVDAFTRDATGAGYGTPGKAPVGTGTWIVVSTPVLTLQPGEELPVSFTVHVPESATPGQYLAGMSAFVPLEASSTTTVPVPENVADVRITLQGQRVIAVQVNVPGPAAAKLAVAGVRPVATPDGLALLLAMENEGNAFAKGTGTVRVESTGLRTGFDIDTFVSNTAIEYRVFWTEDVVVGVHDVAVQLRYDGKQVAWNGTVEITPGLASQLEDELADIRVVGGGDSGLPWPLIVVGLLATLGCAFGAFALRRRRADPRPVPAAAN